MTADLVLVTGATGYVAGHCILQLLRVGYRVRATLRSLERSNEVREWLRNARAGVDPGLALSFVEAELLEPHGWYKAMHGVRYVLHVASPVSMTTPKHPDDLIKPARDGTLNVMRAAAASSVQRVVQTSSTAAILYGRDNPNGHRFTEADWTDINHRDNVPYTRSKTIAEHVAWEELPKLQRKLEWVAINAGLVLGPALDLSAMSTAQLIAQLLRGELPALPRIGFSIVDVRDLADIELRAMTAPQASGERYIASGDFATFSDIAAILKSQLGARAAKVPTRGLPDWIMRIAGIFNAEVRGQTFELGKERKPTCEKAERILGWSRRPLTTTIIDTAESLEKLGALNS